MKYFANKLKYMTVQLEHQQVGHINAGFMCFFDDILQVSSHKRLHHKQVFAFKQRGA